jgi:hypothetical protein
VSITGETTKKIDAPPSTRPAQKAIALAVEEFRWLTLVSCLLVTMLGLLDILNTDVLSEAATMDTWAVYDVLVSPQISRRRNAISRDNSSPDILDSI